jgi:hypothetical protein
MIAVEASLPLMLLALAFLSLGKELCAGDWITVRARPFATRL